MAMKQLVQWIDGALSVFCLFILLMTWYHIKIIDHSFSTKLIGWFSSLGMISFTISAIFKTYREALYSINNPPTIHTIYSSAIYSITWSLGQVFVYLLFIERLKYSFKTTKYASPKRYFYPFYIGIILFLITSITAAILSILYKEDVLSKIFYSDSGNARNLAQCIIDLILSISLLYVFNKKLWKLNKDLCIFNANDHSDRCLSINDPRPHKISLNSRQEAVIKITSKLTIITCFAICSTQFLMLYSTTTFLICGYMDCHFGLEHNYLKPITEGLWGIDCFINCLCIYLSYGFYHAENMYYSCCGCCDDCCIKCCNNCTQKKLEKEYKKNRNNIHFKLSLLSADDMKL